LRTTEGLGPWTDVFLMGGTLYYLLTGTFPYEAATAREAFQKAVACQVEPPEKRTPHRRNPPALCALALEAMAEKPEDRVPSMTVFLERLQDYLSGASRKREAATIVQKVSEERQERGTEDYQSLAPMIARLG